MESTSIEETNASKSRTTPESSKGSSLLAHLTHRPRISLTPLRTLAIDQKTLLIVLTAFGSLCVFRGYHLFTTSFLVSDEYRYSRDAIGGNLVDGNIAQRFVFTVVNAILFDILGIRSLDQFAILLPIYLFFWGGSTIFVSYKLMKVMEFNAKAISATLLSSLGLVSFTLLDLGFVTEPASLFIAMLGVYLLVWFAKKGSFSNKSIGVLFLASLVFAVASFTRETYNIYLIGGMLAVLLTVLSKRGEVKTRGRLGAVMLIVPILVFSVPSVVLLQYPFSFVSSHVTPIIETIASTGPGQQASNALRPLSDALRPLSDALRPLSDAVLQPLGLVQHPPVPAPGTTPPTTTISTVVSVTANSTTATATTGGGPTRTSTILANASMTTTQATAIQTVPPGTIGGKTLSTVIIETFRVFLVGLALGWGPVLLPIAVVGTLLVFRRTLFQAQPAYVMVLSLCILSFGSYFVLSYLAAAGDILGTNSLAFQHYSTIIRFTNTAVPAYFLVAPFAFALISERKRYLYGSLIAVLVFGLFALQAYPAYASSNLGVGSNPFSVGYRSGGAMVRDYVIAHESSAPLYIIGFWQETWDLTVGTSLVKNGTAYFYPNMSESQFISHYWTAFYVYGNSMGYLEQQAPFLVPLVYPNSSTGHSSDLPITVISRQVIANQSAYLVKFEIQWNG